jgi:hypothetical protein
MIEPKAQKDSAGPRVQIPIHSKPNPTYVAH